MLNNLERRAWREAVYALVSTRLGIPVRHVTLGQHGTACRTAAAAVADTQMADLMPRAAAALLAGRVVDRLLGHGTAEAGRDDERLVELLRLHHRSTQPTRAEADRMLEQALSRCELILRSEWGQIRATADWLLRVGVLKSDHLATLLETDRPEVLVAPVSRLHALGKLAGDEPYLARSPALERLTKAACRAETEADLEALEAELEAHAKLAAETPHRAAMETLAAAHKQERLARLRALPPSPSERAAARATSFIERPHPKSAGVLRELKEARARLALSEAASRSGPTTVKGPVDAAHAAWLDRITRGKPPRRRPVTRTRPGWIGA